MKQYDENQLRQMFLSFGKIVAKQTIREAGLEKTQLTKAEAHRKYSRKRVDYWISSGKIEPVKFGSAVLLDALELEALSQAHTLVTTHLAPVKN